MYSHESQGPPKAVSSAKEVPEGRQNNLGQAVSVAEGGSSAMLIWVSASPPIVTIAAVPGVAHHSYPL